MKKKDTLVVLTQQLVSQLLYHSTRLNNLENFKEVSDDMLELIDIFKNKTVKLKNL